MSQTLIVFQDHDQDFLVWTVNQAGVVVKSWPFQTDVWAGLIVTNLATLKAGKNIEYKFRGEVGVINYATKSVLPLEPVEVSVRMDGNGYVTSIVSGYRASCTHDFEYAVMRLAEQLFPDRPATIERLPCIGTARLHSKWLITPECV